MTHLSMKIANCKKITGLMLSSGKVLLRMNSASQPVIKFPEELVLYLALKDMMLLTGCTLSVQDINQFTDQSVCIMLTQ